MPQEFIYHKDTGQLILRPEIITIVDEGTAKDLSVVLAGERLEPRRHLMHIDVKAATLHRFRLSRKTGGCKAFVILDI